MKYILVLKQEAEGCDYSIECGTKVVELKATTFDGVHQEAKNCILSDDEGYLAEDFRLKSAMLCEVVAEEALPVKEWYAEYEAAQHKQERQAQLEKERREYERLKAKFE